MSESESLHFYAKIGNIASVEHLVLLGADLDETDSNNQTPLAIAIVNKNWEIADYLLLQSAKTDFLDEKSIRELLEHLGDDVLYRAFEYDDYNLWLSIKSDENLEKVYSEIKSKNLPISHEVELHVLRRLLEHTYNDTTTNPKPIKPTFEEIKNRLTFTADLIDSSINESDEDVFRVLLRMVATNLKSLKQLLWFTYNECPWEEMEFCVVCYLSKWTDAAYKLVLDRKRLLRHLGHFSRKLKELTGRLKPGDFKSKESLVGRIEKIKGIVASHPEFLQLYTDFALIRNVHSLSRMHHYLQISTETDATTTVGKLTLQRTLQVTGECLKNAPTSPNVSEHIHAALLANAPKDTKKILHALRDSLSHAKSISRKVRLDDYYLVVQRDLEKIDKEVVEMLKRMRADCYEVFMRKVVEAGDEEVLGLFGELGDELEELEVGAGDVRDFRRIEEMVGELEGEVRTEENRLVFEEVRKVLESQRKRGWKLTDIHQSDAQSLRIMQREIQHSKNIKMAKNLAIGALDTRKTATKPAESLRYALDLINKATKSIKKPTATISELLHRIFCAIEFEICRIQGIDEFRENLSEGENEGNEIGKEILGKISENLDEIFKVEFNVELEKKIGIYKSKLELLEAVNNEDGNELGKLLEKFDGKLRKRILNENINWIKRKEFIMKIDDVYTNFTQTIKKLSIFSVKKYREAIESFISKLKFKKNTKIAIDTAVNEYLNSTENEVYNYFNNNLKILEEIFQNNEIKVIIKNNQLISAIEIIMLDLCEILQNLDLLSDCNNFHDQLIPILSGRALRNYLSHGDPFLEIYSQPKLFVIINAEKFLQQKLQLTKTPQIGVYNILHYEQLYDYHYTQTNKILQAINEAKNSENLQKINRTDLKSRNYNNSTLLHSSATTDNIKAFKHLLRHIKLSSIDSNGLTATQLAALNNSNEIIDYILSTTNSDPTQLLYESCKTSNLQTINLLLQKNANPNGNVICGLTPLHFAATTDNPETIKLLISYGANPNLKSRYGKTPLHWGALSGTPGAIDALLDGGAEVDAVERNGATPLVLAVVGNKEENVVALLRRGADPLKEDDIGWGGFHRAAQLGYVEICRIFLGVVEVDCKTREHQETALSLAAMGGRLEVAQLLLSSNANPNVSNEGGNTPLHGAATFGDYDMTNLLLTHGAQPNVTNALGVTPLHAAAAEGEPNTVRALISSGAKINATYSTDNLTPLIVAASYGHADVIEVLLEFEADVKMVTPKGWTALHQAAFKGRSQAVKILCDHPQIELDLKAESGWTPLYLAALGGHEECVRVLIDAGADPNAFAMQDMTPLHAAVAGGHTATALMLINSGALINVKNSTGVTPTHLAAMGGHDDVLKALLEKGANVNDQEAQGMSPLHFAAMYGHREATKMLLSRGANVELKTKDGFTPQDTAACYGQEATLKLLPLAEGPNVLHLTTMIGNIECMRTLLTLHGADVNGSDENGRSPLHYAARFGKLEAAEVLFEAGAEVDATDDYGRTPLHEAASSGKAPLELVLLLLDKGADVTLGDEYFGLTALHFAAQTNRLEVCELFLEKSDIDVDVTSNKGYTPFYIAAGRNHESTAEFLLSKGAEINKQADNLWAPLHSAAHAGHVDMVSYLLTKGANLKILNDAENTPLHCAVLKFHINVIKLIISTPEGSSLLNTPGFYGYTSLHMATMSGHEATSRLLIDAGADVTAVNIHRDSILHTSITGRDDCIVRMVLNRLVERFKDDEEGLKAHIDARDGEGDTPLMWAAEEGDATLTKILLEYGANPECVNDEGLNALQWAQRKGKTQVQDVLQTYTKLKHK